MEGAEYVRAAHDAFLQAGADIVTTNSYAIVPFHIGADVFQARASELLRLSGKLARAAADDAGRPGACCRQCAADVWVLSTRKI